MKKKSRPAVSSENQLTTKTRFWTTVREFFPRADALREVFDARFSRPFELEGRFVWDYWHVPGQYTYFRTQAREFFPADLFQELQNAIASWGREHLGCEATTSPWLSYYVDGCRQELHTDSPHGPWAFVFSLTPWRDRTFSGGETLLMSPEVLSYWRNWEQFSRGLHHRQIFTALDAEFNQLTVFDPRLPHGVAPVFGTRDPRRGRLVLHGWFTPPRIRWNGSLGAESLAPVLRALAAKLGRELAGREPATGLLIFDLLIEATGRVQKVAICTNTVVSLADDQKSVAEILTALVELLTGVRFPRSNGRTNLVLPLQLGN